MIVIETAQAWQEELNRLLARLSAAGVCPDTSDMDLSRQWAVYCSLRRLIERR